MGSAAPSVWNSRQRAPSAIRRTRRTGFRAARAWDGWLMQSPRPMPRTSAASEPSHARAARKPVLLVRLIAEGARWRLFHTEGAADNRRAPGNDEPHLRWQRVEAEELRLEGPEVVARGALRFTRQLDIRRYTLLHRRLPTHAEGV